MDLFEDYENTIFVDKDILQEDYTPDEILERDDEIDEYTASLKDVLFGRNPPDIFLFGKAGVGKTAVTDYVLNQLQETVDDNPDADDLHILKRNCNDDTVHSVLCNLINDLRGPDQSEFPPRGRSRSEAYDALYKEFERIGGTFLLVLDEIDHLRDANSLLYEIPRARANDYIENARVGIIGISNNYQFRNSLSPKVKNSLQEDEISFGTYEAGELRSILKDRAEKALKDDAWDSAPIALCAAKAARDTGSARQAIDLLREGADIAERENDDVVREEHIEQAQERVRRGRLHDRVRDQSMHAQFVLEAVANLEHDGQTPVRSKTIRSTYERVADEYGHDPLTTLKSVQNHLGDLAMLGFLVRSETNQGRSDGRAYEYELDMDVDAVFEVRAKIEEEEEPA